MKTNSLTIKEQMDKLKQHTHYRANPILDLAIEEALTEQRKAGALAAITSLNTN